MLRQAQHERGDIGAVTVRVYPGCLCPTPVDSRPVSGYGVTFFRGNDEGGSGGREGAREPSVR